MTTSVYKRAGDIITIVVQDGATLRKIESWKFNTTDSKLAENTFRHLTSKYGLLKLEPNNKNEKLPNTLDKKKKEDIDWLSMDMDW